MEKKKKKLPIYKMVIDPDKEGSGVDYIALVDEPAIQVDWFAFREEQMNITPEPGEDKETYISRCISTEINNGHAQDQAAAICYNTWENKNNYRSMKFAIDEERKIIVSPAMIPNMEIYRRNEKMGEFNVIFEPDQIDVIQEKFMKELYLNNINEMHDPNKIIDGVFMKNSWVSDKSMGILAPEMFKHLPDRTWYISYKFTPEAWAKYVKTGEFKGVSVEGMFDLVPIDQTFEAQFLDILNKIIQD